MRPHKALFLLLLVLTSANAAERIVGPTPIGHASPKERELARTYGVRLGASYSKVRLTLLKSGWKIDASLQDEIPIFKNYPEIVCGHGLDAICSVAFDKAGKTINITVDQRVTRLPVVRFQD